jgi:hypothetical protein
MEGSKRLDLGLKDLKCRGCIERFQVMGKGICSGRRYSFLILV